MNLQNNLIKFHCSICFCNCCILFKLFNTSISISCTIASCHFLFILISSNSKFFFHVFRYSINFRTFKFSVAIKTMCCSVRESYIVYTTISSFLCNFSASLILFRYLIALIVEIWFLNFAIIRLLIYAQDFVFFRKFFFSCILALFLIFHDITYTYKLDDDVLFNAFQSLCCLEIKEIWEIKFEFFESWFSTVFGRGWIKFIIWFNFKSR